MAVIAARQHGVVSARQLLEAQLTRREIVGGERAGRLHRMHQGVYAVGHRGLSREGRWMAAVLACDQERRRAVLSHRSAAELWGMLDPTRGAVDVSVPGDGGRQRRNGIRAHRVATLGPRQTTRRQGIPVTSAARTIGDLRQTRPKRGGANAEQLRQAVRQAGLLGLAVAPPPDRTRSDLELLFLEICDRHGLPPPEVNVPIGAYEVDFLWRERRVVVETDGYRYHRGRVAFEDDRARDLGLRGLGLDVIRLSDTQLNDEPDNVANAVRRLLAGC